MHKYSGDIRVVLAQPYQIDVVAELLESARHWLVEQGMAGQWPQSLPHSLIAQRIGGRHVYLGFLGESPVGTFALFWDDTEVWGEQLDDAGYVHSLAIHPAYHGRGIGTALLAAASTLIAEAGRLYLRLDCWANNQALCRYYEQQGFQFRGKKTWGARDPDNTYAVHCYERPIALV